MYFPIQHYPDKLLFLWYQVKEQNVIYPLMNPLIHSWLSFLSSLNIKHPDKGLDRDALNEDGEVYHRDCCSDEHRLEFYYTRIY